MKYVYNTPLDSFDVFVEIKDDLVQSIGFTQKGSIEKEIQNDEVAALAFRWLDGYFHKRKVNELPPLNLNILSSFQKKVFALLKEVPFGTVVSYAEIKKQYESHFLLKASNQGIGQALKRNPFPLLVPCHRVIKKNGELGGYAFGLNLKEKLLRFEGLKVDAKSNMVIK